MSLAGDIRDFPFSDLAQLCSQIQCTGKLVLTAPGSGEEIGFFGFENGELFDARLGEAEGQEAFFAALALREGIFRVDFNVRSAERRIFTSIGSLILEGLRRLDRAGEAAPAGQGAPRQTGGLAPPSSSVHPHPKEEGADMSYSTSQEWICPLCGRYFDRDGSCPDDQVELSPAGAEPISLPPPPASTRELLAGRRWRVAIATLLAALVGGAVTSWTIHARRASASAAPPRPPAAARASSELPVVVPVTPSRTRGVTDKEIVFGMAAPFTGPAKELGRQMKLGVETAFLAVNDAGGVHGRQLRLVSADDGYEPARTAEAMKELCDRQQVFGIVGNVGTPTAAMSLPLALERKMLFYGAFTGANLLRREPPDRYVFNFRASYAEETAAVVNYLVKVRRVRPDRIAVFAQQDAFGDAGFAGVTRAIRALRPDVKAIPRFGYQRNTLDVNDAVARLRERPAVHALVMVATYRAAAKFIEKVRDFSPKMVFTNVSFVGSTALAEELKELGVNPGGVIVTQVVPHFDSGATGIIRYREALKKFHPDQQPDFISLEGYIVGTLFAEGLRRAGRELDTEKLVDALEHIQDYDPGTGSSLGFSPSQHQASHKVWGTMLDDQGGFKSIDME
jgi:ABC-type branched-subunit amino acid transport system substrate-binding protein